MLASAGDGASTGVVYGKKPSRFWAAVDAACLDSPQAVVWLKGGSWVELHTR